jgi:hypothetical protein
MRFAWRGYHLQESLEIQTVSNPNSNTVRTLQNDLRGEESEVQAAAPPGSARHVQLIGMLY